MWIGARALLLEEYFESKTRWMELKKLPKKYHTEKTEQEMVKLEAKIRVFLSMLTAAELKSLVLMSLDMEEEN